MVKAKMFPGMDYFLLVLRTSKIRHTIKVIRNTSTNRVEMIQFSFNQISDYWSALDIIFDVNSNHHLVKGIPHELVIDVFERADYSRTAKAVYHAPYRESNEPPKPKGYLLVESNLNSSVESIVFIKTNPHVYDITEEVAYVDTIRTPEGSTHPYDVLLSM